MLPRIAIVGPRGSPARYGGFESFAEELSTRLAAAGYPVRVYCRDEGPAISRGVERVFAIFSEEMKRVLCMTGVPSADAITKSILIRDE